MSDISDIGPEAANIYMQANPYSESFDPRAVSPEAIEQLPGVMGFLTSPGFEQFARATNPITIAGFAAFRSQNTLLRGGIGDDVGSIHEKLRRGRGKFSNYSAKSLSLTPSAGANQFVGGQSITGRVTGRGERLRRKQAAQGGKTPLVKGFLKNNATLNPMRFFRKQSLSEFLAGPGRNFYAPNSGGVLAMLGNIGAKKDNPRFSGGTLARMGALTTTERRAARRRTGAAAKMDLNLARIAKYNAPAGSLASTVRTGVTTANISPHAGRAFASIVAPTTVQTASTISITATPLAGLINKAVSGGNLTVGERRYLMTEGIRGAKTKNMMRSLLTVGGGEEMFTGMGTATARSLGGAGGTMVMTEAAEKLMKPLSQTILANSAFQTRVLTGLGQGVFAGAIPMTEAGAAQMSKQLIQKGFIETLGYRGAAHAAAAGGGRVALAVGGQALLKAMPGINMIFAADLAYQLAKLGGMAVKGAINFGKDAMKSMQGNINGGMFATYKDDEVRATSRARGVMAIQNSRLNARSLLGSEGAMMAAHFG